MARTTHTEAEKATDQLRVAQAKLNRLHRRYAKAVADVERLQVEVETQDALVAHYAAHPALAPDPEPVRRVADGPDIES